MKSRKRRKRKDKNGLTLGYTSPRWSQEIPDCSMPMTFDQYSNCAFSCLYCFSTYQKSIGSVSRKTDYLAKQVQAVTPSTVKRIFSEPDNYQFGAYIKDRKVFQWGGLADPFCGFEKRHGIGLELLRFFREINYPICFSTKSTWWLDDPRYTELFKNNKNWNCKFSIITLNKHKALNTEIGVPSPEERLKAMEKYVKLNAGGATLRLRPFIIGITNPTHNELIKRAGDAGAKAITTEFFCLERRSTVLRGRLKIMSELAGFNILDFYVKYSYGSGYLRLNRKIKKQFIDEMEATAKANKMRFYVSDAHFKERCANGSCCGLPATWNYSKGQFCHALLLCKRKGMVRWSDIEGDLSYAKLFLWNKAIGYNTRGTQVRGSFQYHTMYEYMKWLWNNPKSGQSPYTMFEGIMKPIDKDSEGNLIYAYDKTKA